MFREGGARAAVMAAVSGLIAALVFLGGCAQLPGQQGDPQIVDAKIAGQLHKREWNLKGLTLEGRPMVVDVDTRISIQFGADGKVTGFGAVNRYNGTYSVSGDGKLNWGGPGFAATRMAGPPELMEKEQIYMKALVKVNVAILSRRMLVLQSDDAATVLTFAEAGY